MTQTIAALVVIIGITVATVTATGWLLLHDPSGDLVKLFAGAILTQFGLGCKVLFDKIG